MLPLNYSLRNLGRRRLRTVLTVAGVAIVVLLIGILNAFHRSITGSLAAAADPRVVYLLSIGAESDPVRSALDRGQAETAANDLPGIYEDASGRYVSLEIHQAGTVRVPGWSADREYTAIVRGVTGGAYLLYDDVFITEGRAPRGDFELLVGNLAASRMGLPSEALAIGATVRFEATDWTVVGHFVAPGKPIEAELWVGLDDLMVASRRTDVTLLAARMTSSDQVPYVRMFCQERTDLEMVMLTESDWFAELGRVMTPIALIVQSLTVLMLVGGVFGCANTLYANALGRTQELAVLQTIGYRRREVVGALMAESVMLTLFAGFIGAALASIVGDIPLRLPMGAVRIHVSGPDVAVGMAAALAIGVLGTLAPAWRVSRQPLVDAMKG